MKLIAIACMLLVMAACVRQPAGVSTRFKPSSEGYAVARNSCATCHAIDAGSWSSPNPDAPPFSAIVNKQGLTRETLSAWLRDAHNYPTEMDFELDRTKIDDLVSYMLVLADPTYKPPPS